MSVSADSQRATGIVRAVLANRPDAAFGVECHKVDVPAVCRPDYHGVQYLENPSMAGNCLIGRDGKVQIKRPRIIEGAPATREGGGIRARQILSARLKIDSGTPYRWVTRGIVGHVHPPRAPRAAARFVRNFKEGGGIKFADVNMDSTATKRRIGRKVRQVGVLAFSIPWWIPCSKAVAVDVGGDHKAVKITLWPTPKPKKRKKKGKR